MTIQIGNLMRYQENSYSIIACSKPLEFDPKEYGLTPSPMSTACYRWYWCIFGLSDCRLILDTLTIKDANGNYPTICGVSAIEESVSKSLTLLRHIYRGLQIAIPYTGRVLIGNHYRPGFYIKDLYKDPWNYKNLKELVFENGTLIQVIDQSETAKDIRKMIRMCLDSNPPEHGIIGPTVKVPRSYLALISNCAWWLAFSEKEG